MSKIKFLEKEEVVDSQLKKVSAIICITTSVKDNVTTGPNLIGII